MSVRAGNMLGKYRLVEKLGRGVMAEVYRAYDPGLNRRVAVKVLHSFLAGEEDFLGRFEREATAMTRLQHPNIVRILDFDHEGDLYYIVMEFIDGSTLQAELRERSRMGQPFDPKETARILTAIGNAVDYVHGKGVVHRDLKPANIMFTSEGEPMLTDFGIAKIVGAKRYTMTGAISGTPTYMSPEQGQGERGDERSDIYSLGVILYEMVTGRVPFDADTPFATIMKHINDPLPLPRQVYPQLSESVERVILKALSKEPDDRYQMAGEMARALQQAVVAPAVPIVSAEAAAQIFLSYARKDKEKVENLYQKLSDAGFKPWMDTKDILPGEKWKLAIQKAILDSDFFLACLSANSVNRRGFLQKEIKNALDIWQEMLDSDIYLIPVRLEDCEAPESLGDFQWVNLFEEGGWARLVKAIQVGMERRAKETSTS